MPRRALPLPVLTPVPKSLTVEAAAAIIEIAKKVEARREEIRSQMRQALEGGDVRRILWLAAEVAANE
jgi:hypothetical protein